MKRKILIVEDNIGLSQMQKDWFGQAGYDAITAMNEPIARSLIRKNNFDLIISDVRLPEGDGISLLKWLKKEKMDIPFIITRNMSLCPMWYAPSNWVQGIICPSLYTGNTCWNWLRIYSVQSRPDGSRKGNCSNVHAPRCLKWNGAPKLVAPSDMSVLILGANGTGKESVAQSIHEGSERVGMPFVAVNCGVLPRELAASMLFGHSKGAFTGADTAKEGFFDMAKGGTLFLDEIGTMPFEIQSMLLRVLQENTYIPIGGNKERVADVRIVAATNENIEKRFGRPVQGRPLSPFKRV